MNTPQDELDDRIRLSQALSALPDPEPPPPLFGRIMASRTRRRRQRRWAAVAAAVVGAALLWPLLHVPLAPQPALQLAEQAPQGADLSLRLIDRRLQTAYDRGADAAEIAALWEARARLLQADQRDPAHEENQDAHILSL